MIYFIGTGLNSEDNLSKRAVEAIKKSGFITGFRYSLKIPEMLNPGAEYVELEIYDSLKPEKIDELLEKMRSVANSAVCIGGSPLFFSYAKKIFTRLDKTEYEIITSPSSIEYLAEGCKTDLNDLSILSGHNSHDLARTRNTALKLLSAGRKIGYFVKNKEDMLSLLEMLSSYDVSVQAGFELGTDRENILVIDSPREFQYEHGRWILLIVPGTGFRPPTAFPKNEELDTSGIPASRSWSRSLTVHEMELESAGVVWDIGAGSGATSIWISSFLGMGSAGTGGKVYAVEKDEARFAKLCMNTERYPSIIPVFGDYADVAADLPHPERVLIGGGIDGFKLEKLFSAIPTGTIFVSAIATADSVMVFKNLKNLKFRCDMYSRFSSRELGNKTAFTGEHVFFLLKGEKL